MVFTHEVIVEDTMRVWRSEKSVGDMIGRHRREAAVKDNLFGDVQHREHTVCHHSLGTE